MKLIIVSTFWNSAKFTYKCIKSLKSQNYKNFKAYFIDDMSSDNTFEVAKHTIDNDERFVLIKNTEKKYKCKSFIDTIRDNEDISWDDVIIELDGDDSLYHDNVLTQINNIFQDSNIWISNSKWIDNEGNVPFNTKTTPEIVRDMNWNFSHLRTYRAFLFRSIRDEDLKYNGEYFKSAPDVGFAFPMLEMSGSDHYFFLDNITYLYNIRKDSEFSNNCSHKDKGLQYKIETHIRKLPKYEKLEIKKPN
jgi:glycosyltransferase involved in cell wall biosynthesis